MAGFLTALAALGMGLVLSGSLPTAIAQENKPPEEKKAAGAIMDPSTGQHLKAAVEAIQAQHYPEAEAALGELDLDRLSPYERSRAEELFAVVEQLQGRYGRAREHLKQAIASGGLNDQEASTARFQIAQLYMAENKWQEGADALQEWFKTAQNPNSAAYHLLAVAYYQMGNHAAALEPAQKAVDLGGANPQQSWLQLLLAIQLELKHYRQAVPVVKRLIEAAPTNKDYWLQFVGLDSMLGDTQGAAVPIELAYRGGWLTGEENAERVAQYLVEAAIPYRAAKILNEAMEHGEVKSDIEANELLSNCWLAAKEYDKAVKPLRRAADLSANGELYLRLAQVYVQRAQWGNAADTLRLALDKGSLKNTGDAYLLLGIATYNQKEMSGARSWFAKAKGYSQSRTQAEGWLAHIENEQRASDQKELR